MLDTTVPSVNSALQRARATVHERLPERSQQETLRSLGDERLREIVDRYVQAWERNDVDALAAMLTEGATLAMPPTASWFSGRDAIATGLRAVPLSGGLQWRLKPTRASGQLAARAYLWDDAGGAFVPRHLAVLTLRGALIDEIDAFIDPSVPLLGHQD
jgi:RNA polymerase sigma-70 factor (ECF subfamily)